VLVYLLVRQLASTSSISANVWGEFRLLRHTLKHFLTSQQSLKVAETM